jgi:hypothetical protein
MKPIVLLTCFIVSEAYAKTVLDIGEFGCEPVPDVLSVLIVTLHNSLGFFIKCNKKVYKNANLAKCFYKQAQIIFLQSKYKKISINKSKYYEIITGYITMIL